MSQSAIPSKSFLSLYPHYKEKEECRSTEFFPSLNEVTGMDIVPFSSARAAIVFGLKAMGMSRMDEILVPPFLSYCVLSALVTTAFPVLTTPSRTRAILVYHQFGYPQRLEEIEKAAAEQGWIVVSNCVNTISTRYRGRLLLDWGDMAVVSFSKLYPCNLGGGLVARNDRIQIVLQDGYQEVCTGQSEYAERAFDSLRHSRQNSDGLDEQFEIQAVYGYLPGLVAFPSQAYAHLPKSTQEIEADNHRRRGCRDMIHERFPGLTPDLTNTDVVPFAVPVKGAPGNLEEISNKIFARLGAEVPVLHFDFACNMLRPDYRKALVIGCHSGWTEERITAVCNIIEEGIG